MDWSPLGSNPVSGAPDTIRKVGAGECQRVSDAARDGQSELKRIFAGLDDSIWNDASARKLEQKTPDVLEDLRKLRDGYGDVASALFAYATELESAQSMAVRANERMRAARSSEQQLTDRRGALRERARVLDSERGSVEAEVARLVADQRRLGIKRSLLQQQAGVTTDPVAADSLRRQIAAVTSALAAAGQQLTAARNRLPGIDQQRAEVDQELRSAERSLVDARAEQGKARQLAEAAVTIRDSAAKRAEADVRAAARRTVGTTADKLKYEVRSSHQFNLALDAVDSFAEGLNSAIAVCDVLAMIPGVNVVFGPVTVILRGVALGVALVSIAGHVVKASAGGEPLDAGWFLARGMSALTAVQGAQALTKASAASKAAVLTEKKRLIQGQTKVITSATSEAQRTAVRQFDATEVVRRRVLAHAGQVRRAEGLAFRHPTGFLDTARSLADATHGGTRHLLALTEGSRLGLLTDGAMAVDKVIQGAEGITDLRARFSDPTGTPVGPTRNDVEHGAVTTTWDVLKDHYSAVK